MTDSTGLTRLYAHEMAAGLRAGRFSSRELVDAHLDLALRQDRVLHAWMTLDGDGAREAAATADERLRAAAADSSLPPLFGIPVALKDLVLVRGGVATAGSRILEDFRSPYDAHITERLRAAGAVILGKTNMDEFAMGSSTEHSAYGATANP